MSLSNKKNNPDLMNVQSILNLVTICLIIFKLQYFRKKQRQTDKDCDDEDIAANDYTILVKNIPKYYDAIGDDYDDDLKAFLE